MRVLITGGFGYVGGRLGQHLQQAGHQIVLGSRNVCSSPDWLPSADVVQTKWNDFQFLERICAGVDVLIHAAGMNAQDCALDPIAALEVNGMATSSLVRASVSQGVKRFIYISTAHVYASPLIGTITEETCPRNLHPYATTHRAGEDALLFAHQREEIEGVVLRVSNAFGAPVDINVNCWMLLVNDLCRQALSTNRMVLRSTGFQRRDFITLANVCRAVEHFLDLPANKLGDGVFNVGGAWAPTILEMTIRVADRIHAITGHTPEISYPDNQNMKTPEPLVYGTNKIVGTGFNLKRNGDIDLEIDNLIKFCLN